MRVEGLAFVEFSGFVARLEQPGFVDDSRLFQPGYIAHTTVLGFTSFANMSAPTYKIAKRLALLAVSGTTASNGKQDGHIEHC